MNYVVYEQWWATKLGLAHLAPRPQGPPRPGLLRPECARPRRQSASAARPCGAEGGRRRASGAPAVVAAGGEGKVARGGSTEAERRQGDPSQEDAGDGGAVGGEEGEAQDGADRADDAAGAGAVHHPHHLRRRQGARATHHLRRLGPRQGSWAEGLDKQEADEDHAALDEGEAEAQADLRPCRASQAVPLHHLVHQSQERAAEAGQEGAQRGASQTMTTCMSGSNHNAIF